MFEPYAFYLMACFYIFAGAMHFVKPRFFIKIIPPSLPYKEIINFVSGSAEIVLGVMLLIPYYSTYAAWGLIVLLIVVFPANVYHLVSRGAGMKIPLWVLWLRLPMQGVLIWWAYQYT